jgi:D-sedoheptulose 7-phosphate isomerase
MNSFVEKYISETCEILQKLDKHSIEKAVTLIGEARKLGSRIFVLGVGGSAAHASHFVNDLRKLCDVESYCASDNVAELTARTNDEGWNSVFEKWLKTSRLTKKDLVVVFSVGGGDSERNVSVGLISALKSASQIGAPSIGIVGRSGGEVSKIATCSILIPNLFNDRVTPHTEGLMSVVAHLLVSHPETQRFSTTW